MNKLYLDEKNIKDVLNELIKRSPNHYEEYERSALPKRKSRKLIIPFLRNILR